MTFCPEGHKHTAMPGVLFHHFEAEQIRIKRFRPLEVGDAQQDMTNPL